MKLLKQQKRYISDKIFQMLPYLFTLLVLIMVSLRRRKEDQPPASLGIPYFREER